MRKELQEKLYESYPILYSERNMDMRNSLMCFGFCCGSGWYDILDRLSKKIEGYNHTAKKPKQIRAVQVKEKLGTLRFYCGPTTDEVDGWIRDAEQETARTCEVCGKPGELVKGGWLFTLCDEHDKDRSWCNVMNW